MNIFNRRELTVTHSTVEQARIRDILAAAGVDYTIKTVSRQSPTPFPAPADRARTGSFGQNEDVSREYIFYVAKSDYEKSVHLLR